MKYDEMPFGDLVQMVLEQLGGEASTEELSTHLLPMVSTSRYQKITQPGWNAAIRRACARKDSETGLPEAPCVNGVYTQLKLLGVEEYRVLIGEHMMASKRSRVQAQKYANECENRHGVQIDVDDYATETG